ncbi:MAG: hypothetical protein Tsb0019_17680 [Roseibium sp.]
MRMFGRRKSPPAGGERYEGQDVPPGAGLPVIVMRSSAGAKPDAHGEFYLIEAVSSFAEKLADNGCYLWSEIPTLAVRVHCLFDYLGQVENGGHSLLVGNRIDPSPVDARQLAGGPDPIAPLDMAEKLRHAAKALKACGAQAHLEIVTDLQRWLEDIPQLAKRQTGFQGGRAAGLQMLDRRFRALQKTDPVEPRLARWLASRPEIEIVEDADYKQAVRRLVTKNP